MKTFSRVESIRSKRRTRSSIKAEVFLRPNEIQVKLSRRAKEDRANAFDWFAANYSPELAERWFLGITDEIESLTNNPHRFPIAFESDNFEFELRELLYGTKKNKHRIFFTIVGDVVNVLHIRHSARRDFKAEDL